MATVLTLTYEIRELQLQLRECEADDQTKDINERLGSKINELRAHREKNARATAKRRGEL